MITIADIHSYLRITDTANDVVLMDFEAQVVAEIESYCDRTLTLTTYNNEVLEYKGTFIDGQYNPELDIRYPYPQLFLKNYPVISIDLFDGTTEVDGDDYTVSSANGIVTLYDYVSDDKANITADYVAGYSTCPTDIKRIVLQGVKAYYKDWSVVTAGAGEIESKSVGDYNVKYGLTSENGISSYIYNNQSILNKYKRWEV